MKHKKYLLILFTLIALLQILVPLNIIKEKNKVIKNGRAIKFRIKPFDPSDPFRGKYIKLYFENSLSQYKITKKLNPKTTVNVYFKLDKNDYASIDTVSTKEISNKKLFVKATIHYIDYKKGIIKIKYPFNRFYIEETKSKKIEKNYQKQANNKKASYALVKILNGNSVIEDVIINNKSISNFL